MKSLMTIGLSWLLSAGAMATEPDFDGLIADVKARIEKIDKEDGKFRIMLTETQAGQITVASIRAETDYTSEDPDRIQNMLELSTYCWGNIEALKEMHHVLFCLSYDINIHTQISDSDSDADFLFHFYPGETAIRAEQALTHHGERERVKYWYNAVVRQLWADMVFQLESEKAIIEREMAN